MDTFKPFKLPAHPSQTVKFSNIRFRAVTKLELIHTTDYRVTVLVAKNIFLTSVHNVTNCLQLQFLFLYDMSTIRQNIVHGDLHRPAVSVLLLPNLHFQIPTITFHPGELVHDRDRPCMLPLSSHSRRAAGSQRQRRRHRLRGEPRHDGALHPRPGGRARRQLREQIRQQAPHAAQGGRGPQDRRYLSSPLLTLVVKNNFCALLS